MKYTKVYKIHKVYERYEVYKISLCILCIQSECGKMWTRITLNLDTIYAVYITVEKVTSRFRKKWLHQKIYYNIALTSA